MCTLPVGATGFAWCCVGPIDLSALDSAADGDPADSGDERDCDAEAMDSATDTWLRSTCAPAASYVLERRAPATLSRLEDVKWFRAGDTVEVHQLKKVRPACGCADLGPSPFAPRRRAARLITGGSIMRWWSSNLRISHWTPFIKLAIMYAQKIDSGRIASDCSV